MAYLILSPAYMQKLQGAFKNIVLSLYLSADTGIIWGGKFVKNYSFQ